MIPIKDNIPTDRFPLITVLLILASLTAVLGIAHAAVTPATAGQPCGAGCGRSTC